MLNKSSDSFLPNPLESLSLCNYESADWVLKLCDMLKTVNLQYYFFITVRSSFNGSQFFSTSLNNSTQCEIASLRRFSDLYR